ncbi:MAG: NADP-dependent isocitrate dehydrogenase [Bacteroidota bacterium]|nr:NADP-dependent isocitrate dehydrogenase [Bacteroidota bacterium]
MATKTPITIAYGDGIGPEIMGAVLRILDAAGAQIEKEVIEIGEKLYKKGISSGIEDSSWESLRRTKVFLKAPITTPQGGGVKSLNVTVRKTLGLYANVRPVAAYPPFIETLKPKMDMVIIRENEEDLYAGIEHQQTQEVVQALKLISRPGCERICRYAFEYAIAHNRKKVSCITKDNIMKLTDGLFHKVFNEIGAEYPDVEKDHYIFDIGTAYVAEKPDIFDIIVTLNLYGDVISDVAAEVAGSVGIAGSANIGDGFGMFEAIHGSAPTIAGQNIANPSGLLQGAIQMLVHIGQPEVATKIGNAWLRTIEQGIHTKDIYSYKYSTELVGTQEFADAVIARLGEMPEHFKPVGFKTRPLHKTFEYKRKTKKKALVGVDVFLDSVLSPEEIAAKLQSIDSKDMKLAMIANRGVGVWPESKPETFLSDHWRCRYLADDGKNISHAEIVTLLDKITEIGLDFIKMETLCTFDGEVAYSLAQGE